MKQSFIFLGISFIVVTVIAFSFAFTSSYFALKIDLNDTILMFVGILATFIVVSNYAQVKDVEKKVDQVKDEIKFINKTVDDLYSKIDNVVKNKNNGKRRVIGSDKKNKTK